MSVYKARTRTISFRLSEAEYMELRNLSIANGSRSLSDFARWTVRRAIQSEEFASQSGIEARVRDLNSKTDEIHREVTRLIRLMGREALEN
jgi:hypothetical protein